MRGCIHAASGQQHQHLHQQLRQALCASTQQRRRLCRHHPPSDPLHAAAAAAAAGRHTTSSLVVPHAHSSSHWVPAGSHRHHHQQQHQQHTAALPGLQQQQRQQAHRRLGATTAGAAATDGTQPGSSDGASSSSSSHKAVPHITLIASDVDGTLLNSQQQLTPGVEAAVRAAADEGVPLIVATGKARGPWVPEVLPRLGSSLPGVFLQGLLVADADGATLYSRCLPDAVVLRCIQLAAQHAMTLTAYCSDRIFCAAIDDHTNRLIWYKEPTPEPVGDMESHLLGRVEVQKLIFMAPQPAIDAVRPSIEAALTGTASCTTALSGMLEVLPLGASKGAGLAWLLDYLGLSADGLLALGDGENDIEMLQLAAVGAAMGNAGQRVKGGADYVMPSNDDDGVAEAIARFVLRPRGVTPPTALTRASSG